MSGLLPNVDPEGLLEYSVVYTDRALNHMSAAFQGVMKDISRVLKQVYNAKSAVVVPGSGTFGMEAVARQFATDQKVMVIRNGWFSFRWTQIFDMGRIPSEQIVLKARQPEPGSQKAFAPAPVKEVVAAILEQKPAVVFAPQVETSAGMLLPDDYLREVAAAVREVDGLFVVDAIAAGTLWVDMAALGIDIVVSAPQKGWSGSPCAGLVMLGERARARIDGTTSTSYAADLKKWLQIMEAYENGGHAYHATLPTDALTKLRDVMLETERYGFDKVKANQIELGRQIRALLEAKGFDSVAAEGFKAPCVVVSYTSDPDIQSGKKFTAQGLQIAAGVPLQVDEPADFRTFRVGLFGLDKLQNVERTVQNFKVALDKVAG
ncbi:aminotransferase class V-fold PLP-dependent enzyme [Methyloversatilis sp.]|uniref:aminotransferase class V-fold PLP-dependent enzyme n=1 Tax=Methyloversatilis sp. TaxID=2569862 RepID=UPI003D299EE6